MLLASKGNDAILVRVLTFAGEPVMALIAGNLLAISLFGRINTVQLNRLLDQSISKAGSILAITAAGGIFGAVIKETGMGVEAGDFLAETGLGLFIPFLIAAFLKTAQGSSTIAMMTAASVVAPMLVALGLGGENGVLLATLAMGAGSMVVSHTNDSFFWVVTRFSELETRSALKVFTPATLVLGTTAFAIVMLLSIGLL
jgi:GntP family gluconate:H+ symporter